ncbi:MAG: hypothetical protein J4F50_11395 [Acidimicrobiia bacterium]|nr:hypothetical protein [Acidimicrobiia bacterium]
MAAVTVSRSEDRLIAIKQVPAARADEIEREADLLRRLDHPGLVRFIEVVETADGGRALHTEFVNSDTWATRPLTDPAERASGMAVLAALVADLHRLGVAHLQLTAPHVLHGADDRPVLCGLTRAAEATPENRQIDLAALGELCHDSSLGRGALAGKLSSLADAAQAGMLSARELARRLDLLAARKPTGSDPVRLARGGRSASLKRLFRPKSLITAGAFAVSVVAAFALGSRSGTPAPLPETPAPISAEDPIDAADPGPDPVAEPNPNGPTPLTEEPELTVETGLVDEPDPIEKADTAVTIQEAAAVLEYGGRRYAVGAAGDFVETGDWDCDGRVTAAIVRPRTGGVVLFDAWPEPGKTIALPVRWSVDSSTGAEAVAHGQCDLLRVYTNTGSRLFNPGEAS